MWHSLTFHNEHFISLIYVVQDKVIVRKRFVSKYHLGMQRNKATKRTMKYDMNCAGASRIMPSYWYRDSHYEPETVVRSFKVYNGYAYRPVRRRLLTNKGTEYRRMINCHRQTRYAKYVRQNSGKSGISSDKNLHCIIWTQNWFLMNLYFLQKSMGVWLS